MASENRQDASDLIEQLSNSPWEFDFFQAVRLLECIAPDLPPMGTSMSPRQDLVRFGQHLSLAFAPSSLDSFTPGTNGRPARLNIRFTGLTGPSGPLPLRMTEFIRNRVRGTHDIDVIGTKGETMGRDYEYSSPKDGTLAAFLDIFHHRIISLFYRAWAESQKTVDTDRSEGKRFPIRIGSTFGMGMPEMFGRDSVPDSPKLAFAAHLSCQTRHSEGLNDILATSFGVPAEIQTFHGHWMILPKDSQCRMGESPQTGTLGQSIMVGKRVWDRQLKFRVVLGPMSFEKYKRLLPGYPSNERLNDWIRLYTHRQWFWETQLILRKEEVPRTQLGQGSLLGWTTWMTSSPLDTDADDMVLPGDDEEL